MEHDKTVHFVCGAVVGGIVGFLYQLVGLHVYPSIFSGWTIGCALGFSLLAACSPPARRLLAACFGDSAWKALWELFYWWF